VVDSLWNKLHALEVSVVAIQDTRLQNPDLQIQAQKQASMWTEGAQTSFSWSNAPHLGTAEGVAVGVKGSLSSRVMKRKQANLIQDQKGWNRFTGVVLQGQHNTKLAIISLYVPCANSTSWIAQKDLLIAKQDNRDPREVAIMDVMEAIDKLGDNIRIILAGDFNMPWNEKGRAGVMDATEKKLTKLLNSL
jgi:hypothetical protein